MRKTIDVKWMEKKDACTSGIEWFKEHGKRSMKATMLELAIQEEFSNLGWLIEKALQNKKEAVTLAIFSASRCIQAFEKEYPNDDRPRKAIEAAQAWLDDPTEENRSAAKSAESAARSVEFQKIIEFMFKK